MMEIINHTTFSPAFPYREQRPTSSKLIFIVCEGAATEDDYFRKVVSQEFDNIKTKVQVINIFAEILKKPLKGRTSEEKRILSSSSPKNLLDEMKNFILKKEEIYEFSKHNDDEFWLIMDVDKHTDSDHIQDWNRILNQCDEEGYHYAISNPFFELWLLLHHDDVNIEDYGFAVTETHTYKSTAHFRKRLRELKVPLKSQKHIKNPKDYTKDNIQKAVERAKSLDKNNERYPTNLGSTVYRLMELMLSYDKHS